jgi:hypothetical protein
MRRERRENLKESMTQPVITHIGSGKYSDVFKIQKGKHSTVMKLSYYRDDVMRRLAKALRIGDYEGADVVKNSDAIAISSNFSKYTNAFIESNVCPHFMAVYGDVDCSYMTEKLKALLKNRLATASAIQMKYNNVSFLEQFDSNMTKYMSNARSRYTDETLRALIFQLLYTLAVCQRLFPGFRHNDLSTNNVLVKRLRTPMSATYKLNDRDVFYVTHIPVLVALADYDFLHVPNHPGLINERVVSGRYKVDDISNPTYDTHFLLKSVLKCIRSRSSAFPSTMAFLSSIPLNPNTDRISGYIPGLEPRTLLTHAYFTPLRVPLTTKHVYSLDPTTLTLTNAIVRGSIQPNTTANR